MYSKAAGISVSHGLQYQTDRQRAGHLPALTSPREAQSCEALQLAPVAGRPPSHRGRRHLSADSQQQPCKDAIMCDQPDDSGCYKYRGPPAKSETTTHRDSLCRPRRSHGPCPGSQSGRTVVSFVDAEPSSSVPGTDDELASETHDDRDGEPHGDPARLPPK